jgi:mRNA interferase HicA
MKGSEFIRKIKALGRKNGVPVQFVARRGKGSHGTLFYGEKFTIVRNPKDELKTGTLHAMLAQLGVTRDDVMKV